MQQIVALLTQILLALVGALGVGSSEPLPVPESTGPSRSVLGADADLLLAGAAVTGPILAAAIAAFFGVRLYNRGRADDLATERSRQESERAADRSRQESERAADRFITNGIEKLHAALSEMATLHIQNFQAGTYIIRTLKTYKKDGPLKANPDDFPKIMGLEMLLPLDSILPVRQLIGDKDVADWAAHAMSDYSLEAKEINFQIRTPIVAYYDPGSPAVADDVLETLANNFTAVLDAWESRVSAHAILTDSLSTLVSHLSDSRPSTISEYLEVSKRSEIATLRQQIKDGYRDAMDERRKADPILRSGGAKT